MSRLPSVGITQSLEAPGLAVPPPVLTGQALQLAQALGVITTAGHLASDISVSIRHDEVRRREEEARAKSFLEGLASQDYRTALPGIVSDIAARKIAPDLGQTPEDKAAQIASTYADGHPPAYADFIHERMTPLLAQALVAQRDDIRAEARDQNLRLASSRLLDSNDAMDAAGILQNLKNAYPDLKDQEVSKVVLDAAESAARAGQSGRFSYLSALAPQSAGPEVSRLGGVLESAQARNTERRDQEGRDYIAGLVNQGVNPGFIDYAIHSDTRLSDQSKQALSHQNTERARSQEADAILSRITLGAWDKGPDGKPSPQATADEIKRRMELPETSAEKLSGAAGAALLTHLQETLRFDAQRAYVEGTFRSMESGASPSTPPALPKEAGNAMLSSMTARGVVSGMDNGGGKFVMTGVRDPVAFANYASSVNMVPEGAQDLIRAGASSADAAQAADAFTVYAAIALKNPGLAASIDLPGESGLKARYIVARLENANPADTSDPVKLRGLVAGLAGSAVRMDPTVAALAPDQVKGRIFNRSPGDPGFGRNIDADKLSAIKDAVKGAVGSRPGSVPLEVDRTYDRALVEEFKFAKSLGAPDDKAVQEAKDAAAKRTLSEHPLDTWGGSVRFGRKGEVFADPQALRNEVGATLGADHASYLWNTAAPESVATRSGRPGWAFRSLEFPHDLYRYEDGTPVVVSLPAFAPIPRPTMTPTQKSRFDFSTSPMGLKFGP